MHRQLEPRDVEPLARCVAEVSAQRQACAAKPWFKFINPDVVLTRLLTNPLVWIINETYLVSLEVGSPWYTDKRLVEEQLVVKLYPEGPGSFAEVTEFLKAVPEWVGAEGTGVGTALTEYDAPLVQKYTEAGFVPVATTLFYAGPTTENPNGRTIRRGQGEEGR